jgi:hypothetical protein
MFNNGSMPKFLVEELNRHTWHMRFNDELKFIHIIPMQMMEEILASSILLQKYVPTQEQSDIGVIGNPFKWDADMNHPQIVPIHEITVDGWVWIKNPAYPDKMQLATCRRVDAELVRALIRFPTMPRQLEKMTVGTPHDLPIISLKGPHYASRAHHLGEAETEVSRRVNFPRRMSEDLRQIKVQFNDMGTCLPTNMRMIWRRHLPQSKNDLIDATKPIVERQFH